MDDTEVSNQGELEIHLRDSESDIAQADSGRDDLESDGSDDETREDKLIKRIRWGLVEGNGSEKWMNRIRQAYHEDSKKGLYLMSKVITCDGEAFPIDKSILMASSGYFSRAFARQRAFNSHQLTITIPPWLNITKEVFGHVLDLIFTRRISDPSLALLPDFVRVCRDLEVHHSIASICKWMFETSNAHNCIEYWRTARLNGLDDVKDDIFDVILAVIEKIPMEKFQNLTYEELSEILSHDKANIRREEMTMKLIAHWILSSPGGVGDKKLCLSTLLPLVRFGNAATGYIPRLLAGHELGGLKLLLDDNGVRAYLSQVHSVLLEIQADPSPSRYDIYTYPYLRPRIPREILFIFGGYVGSSPCKLLETYDSRVNKWFRSEVSSLSQRSYHGMVCINGSIYMIGGFDGTQQLRTVSVIDPLRGVWLNRASMAHSRCYVAVAELKGKIYACGGFNGRARHRSCEVYDPSTDSWSEIAPMNEIRSDATAVCSNGRIYIIGGFNGQQVHNTIEFYDEIAGQWQYLPQPMVISRSGVNSVVWNNKVIVIGGNSGHHRENTVEMLDIDKGTWSFLPNMNTTRSNFAACVMEDTLYVLGGYDGFGTTNNCESLDLTRLPESKWTSIWPLTSSRSALSACVVSGLPNAKRYSWLRKELDSSIPRIERSPSI